VHGKGRLFFWQQNICPKIFFKPATFLQFFDFAFARAPLGKSKV
jgi:hypothetical protein